jgi:hypothetical protein
MCTLSLVTRERGFLLGMNRDERLKRERAEPPQLRQVSGTRAIFPTEPSGGTWIAANEHGCGFAILNQNSAEPRIKLRSRGEIIPQLITCTRLEAAHQLVTELDLNGLLPFLLIGISAPEQRVSQWRYDGRSLALTELSWRNQHWFSSGVSDAIAKAQREPIALEAWNKPDAGSPEWLRALHRDHGSGAGAFSICVHRSDAATVSYSELQVTTERVTFGYQPGNPCISGDFLQLSLRRAGSLAHQG